jgi:putative copper export protein
MSTQNYSNHTRFDKLYHFTIVPLVLVGLVGSIVNFSTSSADNNYVSALLVVVFFLLFLIAGLARIYSLKVQD